MTSHPYSSKVVSIQKKSQRICTLGIINMCRSNWYLFFYKKTKCHYRNQNELVYIKKSCCLYKKKYHMSPVKRLSCKWTLHMNLILNEFFLLNYNKKILLDKKSHITTIQKRKDKRPSRPWIYIWDFKF